MTRFYGQSSQEARQEAKKFGLYIKMKNRISTFFLMLYFIDFHLVAIGQENVAPQYNKLDRVKNHRRNNS